MDSTDGSFSYGPAQISFKRYGYGAKKILAFHGFGQQAENMLPLAKVFDTDYSFYSFDIFFHGRSLWQAKDVPISQEFWQAFFHRWLESENIDRFTLIGFSMGCKFCLSTLHAFPERTDRIILLAPDGLAPNRLYRLAVGTERMRNFLKKLIFKPFSFFALVSTLRTLHLVNPSLLKFAASQMNTREKRWRVYNSWISFRMLHFSPADTAELLNRYRIPAEIFIGKFDRVITRRSIEPLVAQLHNARLHVLESGHGDFVLKAARFYRQELGVAA
ncbi:MAG: alpha/beta hydrolase [Bacteroidota bacterium]